MVILVCAKTETDKADKAASIMFFILIYLPAEEKNFRLMGD
jgi:hypothetical protein